jgi:hypothetical protein
MDFYGTTAQVIPVLLLALVWESGYLERVKGEDRSRYPVFRKPVVRWWGLFMTAAALAGEATMLLVLAGILDQGDVSKAFGLVAVAAVLGSMAVRLSVDIWRATREDPAGGGGESAAATSPSSVV